MENEFNNYHINNPDGASRRHSNEGRLRFNNDAPRFIKEAATSAQKEFSRPNESFNRSSRPAGGNNQSGSGGGGANNNVDALNNLSSSLTPATETITSSATASLTTGASAAASVGSSLVTAVGSGVGAIAGVVASTVATAVLFVAVFISSLTVNLSLVMADVDCLVLRLEMQGAQDQDFENGVFAILESSDGTHQEQQINPDSVFITFSDLAPHQEYFVRIQSGETLFAEKSFVTASSRISRGTISARTNKYDFFIDVNDVITGTEGFFTVKATDSAGKDLFVKDDKGTSGSYSFSVYEPKKIHCTLSIGGVTYAVADAEVKIEPAYNFNAPIWSWTGTEAATLSFIDENGGDPLVIPATIASTYNEPTCVKDGSIVYRASAVYNDKEYFDEVTDVLSATGHAYGATPVFVWTETADGYTAQAMFVCQNDNAHFVTLQTIVRAEHTDPTCEEDGYITFTATATDGDETFTDTKIVTDAETALGHDYSEAEFIWTALPAGAQASSMDDPVAPLGYSVVVRFHCANNHDHYEEVAVDPEDVNREMLLPSCEENGFVVYYAFVLYHDEEFRDEREEELTASFDWEYTDENGWDAQAVNIYQNGTECIATFPANIDYDFTPASCYEGAYSTFTATAEAGDLVFTDSKIFMHEDMPAYNNHLYTRASFEWTPVEPDPDDDPYVDPETGLALTHYSVFVKFLCYRNNDHFETATIAPEDITSYEITPPTCDTDGTVTYYARIIFEGKEFYDEHVDTYEAIGHNYGETPVFKWTLSGDEYTAQAVLVCANDPNHNHDILLETEVSSQYSAPVCDADGYTTFTATTVIDGETYTATRVKTYNGTRLGHGDMEYTRAVPATFSQSGILRHYTCPVCGKHYESSSGYGLITDVVIPQLTQLDGKTFTAWESANSLPTETGNYYLTTNVEIETTWEIGANKEINICLNTHTITVAGYDVRFLNLGENATFGLYECEDLEDVDEFITGYYWINQDTYGAELTNREDYYQRRSSGFTCGIIYGGYITGCHVYDLNGAVIYAQDGSVTNLKGGTIIGNSTDMGCGGVFYSGPGVNAAVHLDGADLIGNIACNVNAPLDGNYGGGGAIYCENGSITMSAGRLLHNSAYRSTAIRVPDPIPGVEGTGVFTMTGGEISNTGVNMYVNSSGRDGVVVIKNGTFNMSGGLFEYNNAAYAAIITLLEGEEDGVPYSGTFNMSGGTIRDLDNNFSYIVLVGNATNTFIVSGNVNINAKSMHPNVYLASGATITVAGELTGQIKVTMDEPGVFTSGYSEFHSAEDEVVCFVSDNSEYGVKIIDGEVALVEYLEVSFETDGGTEIASQYVFAGEHTSAPTAPNKENCSFLYWYIVESPDTPFDFANTPIEESITLYAKWDEA